MTTPTTPVGNREQAAVNPNVLLGVLLAAVLMAVVMGFFHLDAKIDGIETRLNARFDRLTELLLSGKVKVTVE